MAASDPGRLGLHYDLRYEFSRTRADPEGHHVGLAFTATGFEDAGGDDVAVSTAYLETSEVGRCYSAGSAIVLSPEQQRRYLELLEIPRADLGEAEGRELDALIARVTDGRTFLSYDVHQWNTSFRTRRSSPA